jgi:hypothetical protein
VFPAAPAGGRFASVGHAMLGDAFFERFGRRFSLSPGVVIGICFALKSRYLAGDDSAATPYAVASSIFSVFHPSRYAAKCSESALSARALLYLWQMCTIRRACWVIATTALRELLKISGSLRRRYLC